MKRSQRSTITRNEQGGEPEHYRQQLMHPHASIERVTARPPRFQSASEQRERAASPELGGLGTLEYLSLCGAAKRGRDFSHEASQRSTITRNEKGGEPEHSHAAPAPEKILPAPPPHIRNGPIAVRSRLEAGALRPARLAARGTALIRLEAVERRAQGNLVGIARPDDGISYFFRRLPCFVGALQPRGVDRAL
jgi:hypothetical protein